MKPEVTDTSLPIGEALRGRETDVFNALVERYSMRIYHHLRRMTGSHDDANDLVQETYLRVWKALPKFRGDSEWFTWIYRIATNLCLSFLEKRRRMPTVVFDSAHSGVSATDDELDGEAILKRLNDSIALLPEKQRAVFCMRYFDEMSYDQISAVTSTSVGALKASYHHAMKKLEDYITHPQS